MENNIELSKEELKEFLLKIGFTEERAESILQNEGIVNSLLPQWCILYKDIMDSCKQK